MNRLLAGLAVAILALGCSSTADKRSDPMKNSKQLIGEGHRSLYNNGAFKVPGTSIHLIPAGPSTLAFASELAGLKARQSFQLSIQHAREALSLAPKGSRRAITIANSIRKSTRERVADANRLGGHGVDMVRQSPRWTYEIVKGGLVLSARAGKATAQAGREFQQDALASASRLDDTASRDARNIFERGKDSSAQQLGATLASAGRSFDHAGSRFIQGYVSLPSRLKKRRGKVSTAVSFEQFQRNFKRSNKARKVLSENFTDIAVDATRNYTAEVAESLTKARDEITVNSREIGITLASLKALRWALQGVLWDGIVEPAAKLTVGTVGYIASNTIVYPVLLVAGQTLATAEVAVSVSWNSTVSAYELIAPTGEAAIAGAIGIGKLVGGTTLAAGNFTLNTTLSGVSYVGGKAAAGTAAATGVVAGQTLKYVGAPMATVGVAGAGTLTGVVAGTAAATTGSALAVGSYSTGAVTAVGGTTAAGAVVVGGTAVAVTGATALATFEASKAIVQPVSYQLGAGIVVGYDTLAQLSAHSLLAVSDAAYVVLSLEGPRWVLYAVKGKTHDGDDLLPGALVDLNAMQQQGEEFYRLPGDEEDANVAAGTTVKALPIVETQ